jgi:dTDP-4-dehydrorhamnose reductase
MSASGPARLLVLGASGLVGSALCEEGRAAGHTVLGAARRVAGAATEPLDLNVPGQLEALLARWEPTHVALCAAYAHVDGCEQDPQRSRRENVEVVARLVAAARGSATRLLFYSTDHVFDGRRERYVESDPVNPLSVYARHKREAEELLLAHGRSLVVRTAWVFGEELRRKNFMYRVIAAARSGERLALPAGQSGCPTWSRWLAASTLALLAQGLEGLAHLSGAELLSKAAWAQLLAEELQLGALQLSEVPWEQSGQLAPRPVQVALASERHALVHPALRPLLRSQRPRFDPSPAPNPSPS